MGLGLLDWRYEYKSYLGGMKQTGMNWISSSSFLGWVGIGGTRSNRLVEGVWTTLEFCLLTWFRMSSFVSILNETDSFGSIGAWMWVSSSVVHFSLACFFRSFVPGLSIGFPSGIVKLYLFSVHTASGYRDGCLFWVENLAFSGWSHHTAFVRNLRLSSKEEVESDRSLFELSGVLPRFVLLRFRMRDQEKAFPFFS